MTDKRALEIVRIARKCADVQAITEEDRVAEGEETRFFVAYLKIMLEETSKGEHSEG